ncbi:MAG: class I mannose-6-phosphate isomerase [Actinobacteria bacterium]|nr:class I mannose-6-phosphate isomerase [Actinomycetota bacterium]
MSVPVPYQDSTYDKRPSIPVAGRHAGFRGEPAWERLAAAIAGSRVTVIDCYPGVDVTAVIDRVRLGSPQARVLDIEDEAALPIAQIDAMIAGNLTDDRVFGVMSHLELADFYDAAELDRVAAQVEAADGPVVLVGWGAALVPVPADLVVLADLPRWEIQQRQRAGMPNWRCANGDEDVLRKYKRGFFVEWRIADRHKRPLLRRIDLLLDTTASIDEAVLVPGEAVRAGLRQATTRPFRVVPFFDPGVWGGQWMRQVCGLDADTPNFAWCFDCVPEENSLLLDIGEVSVEIPAINLVHAHPEELLGARTHARFGPEFPIRFDFLDTMNGGNLSLQVHPLTGYIQDQFGMHYTQDESYYLLDATDDAVVYLGLRTGTDPDQMMAELRDAQGGQVQFEADRYVNTFPARKHDHFLIPAGTVHCSGSNAMVLEISATPFIFTFKMWDWGRVGLDGLPRPINIDHAEANIRWDRDSEWTAANLVDRVEEVARGEGWVEERTGLHELEFIEVRRHWFTAPVPHDTAGTVNVLNLVEGAEAIVESPSGAFEPFVVHYAETFIVPAAVGPYTIRPYGRAEGQRCATVKAFVRGTQV